MMADHQISINPTTIVQDFSRCVVIDTNFPENIPGIASTDSNGSPSLSSSSSVENKRAKTSPYSNFSSYSAQPTAIIKYEPTESKKEENPTFKEFNRPVLSPSQIPKKSYIRTVNEHGERTSFFLVFFFCLSHCFFYSKTSKYDSPSFPPTNSWFFSSNWSDSMQSLWR